MLELTTGGRSPLELQPDLHRTWIEDLDTVSMTAWCEKDGLRVGFGDCSSMLLPPISNPAGHPK